MPRIDSTSRLLRALLITCALLAGATAAHAQELATVYRDQWGVPHIFGPTDASVMFAAAWVQAEEDWPAVERNFLRSEGRGAELLGAEEALLDDYLARALAIPRLSQAEYAAAEPRMRAMLDAHAAGFNAWLAANPEARGVLERVEPWHTLAFIRFKYHLLEFLGYAGFREAWAQRLIREGLAGAPAVGAADADRWGSVARFAEDIMGPMGDIPVGSNEWALGPSRTADGTTMLLVNPHQGFFGVERYLEIHLASDEGLQFSGLTRFGFLLPYMGNNARLGWTYTDNYADISDLYFLTFDDPADPLGYRYHDWHRAAETWTETVRVKDEPGRTFRFWRTHHGPIVGIDDQERPLAARIAKLEEGGWFDQLDAMIRASNLDEYRAAIGRLDVPYMNNMYADADGNIQYVYGSAVPRRDPSFDWRQPVDGSDPRTEWGDYHPLEDLPQVVTPASGWLLNTNSSPMVATEPIPYAREDFPPYMIGDEDDNARAKSSRRLLGESEDVTLDGFARLAMDTRISLADELVPVFVSQWEALESAAAGDAAVGAAPVPAALAPGSAGRAAVGRAVERLAAWDRRAHVESVETTWFVIGLEKWFMNRQPTRPFAYLEYLAEALAGLEASFGTADVAWGEVNRLQRPPTQDDDDFSADLPSFPVPGAPGATGSVFSFNAHPFGSTGVRYGVGGNTFVKVIEFTPDGPRGRSHLVFGQSGDPESPHFFDQAPLYSRGEFKPAWWTRAEVEANAVRSYTPGAP